MTTLLKINASLFSAKASPASSPSASSPPGSPPRAAVSCAPGANPVPHLDGARFMAFLAKPEERSADSRRSSISPTP
jgi:FMN-dependent NADH-azoreductase